MLLKANPAVHLLSPVRVLLHLQMVKVVQTREWNICHSSKILNIYFI